MTRHRPTSLAAVAFLSIAMVTLDAHADAREASRLVRRGEALGKAGDYAAALEKFLQAEAVEARPIHHCYIGLAHGRMGELTRSLLHFDRCQGSAAGKVPLWVEGVASDIRRQTRREGYARLIVEVEPNTAHVRVEAGALSLSLEGSAALWLPPGTATIFVEHPEHESGSEVIELRPGQERALTIALSRRTPEVASPVAPVAPSPPPKPVPPETDSPEGVTVSPSSDGAAPFSARVAPWVLTGFGVLCAVTGGTFHILASGDRDRAGRLPPGDRYQQTVDRFETRRAVAFGAYGVGVVSLGAGLTWLLWPAD